MSSFDNHWKNIADRSIPHKKLEQANRFIDPLLCNQEIEVKASILDAGCGDGVHLEVLKKHKENIVCTAIDISEYAVNSINKRFSNEFCKAYIANVNELPFDDECFDIVFSYGVIAYSDNPRVAVKELSRVLKKTGIIGIWIYPCESKLKRWVFKLARLTCQLLGDRLTNIICHLLVPFMSIIPISSKINIFNSTWKACHEVLMVNLNPSDIKYITKSQLELWLGENDLTVIEQGNGFNGAVYAKKNSNIVK